MSIPRPTFPERYGNFINGQFVAPVDGQYFDNISPIDGQVFIQAARANSKDIENAIDAAWTAFESWKRVSVAERSGILLKIADIAEVGSIERYVFACVMSIMLGVQANLMHLATVETIDNGKAVRETIAADLPLLVDHFRYFAGVIRADEGTATEIDATTLCLNIKEPIGVVGQIIPWNFPLLMAAWKMCPALAAGNCVILKPAEQTPTSIMVRPREYLTRYY